MQARYALNDIIHQIGKGSMRLDDLIHQALRLWAREQGGWTETDLMVLLQAASFAAESTNRLLDLRDRYFDEEHQDPRLFPEEPESWVKLASRRGYTPLQQWALHEETRVAKLSPDAA